MVRHRPVNLTMPPEEVEALDLAAVRAGMSRSAYIRYVLRHGHSLPIQGDK